MQFATDAKGKIERRFGTFQNRLVALLAYAGVKDYLAADEILQMEILRQNSTVCSSTTKVPLQVFQQAQCAGNLATRPCPVQTLLNLHLSLRSSRRVHNDNTIEFDGRSLQIAPTNRKSVTVLFHPNSRLWVLETPPAATWPTILGDFSL